MSDIRKHTCLNSNYRLCYNRSSLVFDHNPCDLCRCTFLNPNFRH